MFVALYTLHGVNTVISKAPHDNLIVITSRLTYLTPVVVEACPVHTGSVSTQDALQLHARVIHDVRADLHPLCLGRVVLAELGAQVVEVPQPARLVQTGADDQVAAGVPVGAHHLVAVPGQDDHVLARLPVHDAHAVVVARGQQPGQLGMEGDGADVVRVQCHLEHDFARVEVLDVEVGVVRPTREDGLRGVEVQCAHWPAVFVEHLQQ